MGDMDIACATVVATVTTLFILGLTVSRYFVLIAVGVLALALFADSHQLFFVSNNMPASEAPMRTVASLTPHAASPPPPPTQSASLDGSLQTFSRDDLNGEQSEEARALLRIEQARESFQGLDSDDAPTWGEGQNSFLQEYRLNNMGDDDNTVTYLHPDYRSAAVADGDMWQADTDDIRAQRGRRVFRGENDNSDVL